MPKKFDKFGLTYLDTETGIVGINTEIGLLDLIAMTHPEKYAEIENKAEFLSDISQVNTLLQEIYLRDNESRWQASDNIEEIDTIINSMPHLQPSPEPLENDCELLIVPGSTGISMCAMFATVKKAILEGIKVKNIAVLGCGQEWKAEWVNEVKTVFSLRPDLLKEGIDLELIDFAKIYTEHDVNALISELIDLDDASIHFEFLPVPMKVLNDGRVVKPNTNDEALVLKQYYKRLQDEMGANPVTMLVSPKGFHLRQSYCYVEAGIGDVKVLMADLAILGEELCSEYGRLVNPSTRAKLDNLAKTIYQTLQIIKTLYPELSVPKVSSNPSMLQMMNPNSTIAEGESKSDQVTPFLKRNLRKATMSSESEFQPPFKLAWLLEHFPQYLSEEHIVSAGLGKLFPYAFTLEYKPEHARYGQEFSRFLLEKRIGTNYWSHSNKLEFNKHTAQELLELGTRQNTNKATTSSESEPQSPFKLEWLLEHFPQYLSEEHIVSAGLGKFVPYAFTLEYKPEHARYGQKFSRFLLEKRIGTRYWSHSNKLEFYKHSAQELLELGNGTSTADTKETYRPTSSVSFFTEERKLPGLGTRLNTHAEPIEYRIQRHGRLDTSLQESNDYVEMRIHGNYDVSYIAHARDWRSGVPFNHLQHTYTIVFKNSDIAEEAYRELFERTENYHKSSWDKKEKCPLIKLRDGNRLVISKFPIFNAQAIIMQAKGLVPPGSLAAFRVPVLTAMEDPNQVPVGSDPGFLVRDPRSGYYEMTSTLERQGLELSRISSCSFR